MLVKGSLMTNFEPATLPAPLPDYFGTEDHSATTPLFSPDATVLDEGETHRGAAAIAAWLDRVEAKYHPRYAVQSAEWEGDRVVVTIEVSGTFPGSPALLRQAFTLDGNARIARLETL